MDAKKTEGGWMFRPFQRRLAGAPPGVAYVGLRWTWTPRIWDPQASRTNMPVTYSSQSLPGWLSWKDDVLSGIPPHDAQSCDVTVEARVGFFSCCFSPSFSSGLFFRFTNPFLSLVVSLRCNGCSDVRLICFNSSCKTERKRFSRILCISRLRPWQLSMRRLHRRGDHLSWVMSNSRGV